MHIRKDAAAPKARYINHIPMPYRDGSINCLVSAHTTHIPCTLPDIPLILQWFFTRLPSYHTRPVAYTGSQFHYYRRGYLFQGWLGSIGKPCTSAPCVRAALEKVLPPTTLSQFTQSVRRLRGSRRRCQEVRKGWIWSTRAAPGDATLAPHLVQA